MASAIFNKLNDPVIISDLRIKHEDNNSIVFGVKRSHFRIRIPKHATPEIAYLAGAIAGDGSFYLSSFKDSKYPRVRLVITSGDASYLDLLNRMFVQVFGAGGRIRKDTRKRSCYDLLVNHRVIWLYFKKVLELDKKKLVVPKQVANQALFRFFMAGFFDTDGYISRGIFGTMMGGRSLRFLHCFIFLAHKFYSLKFSPVRTNTLSTKTGLFKRIYTRLRKSESGRFVRLIPLKNKKYGPAQIRTGDIRCVRATC